MSRLYTIIKKKKQRSNGPGCVENNLKLTALPIIFILGHFLEFVFFFWGGGGGGANCQGCPFYLGLLKQLMSGGGGGGGVVLMTGYHPSSKPQHQYPYQGF